MQLKALRIHVYFATIKNLYFINGKNLEANEKVTHALNSILNDEYLFRVSNFDSAFIVWNTLIFPNEQKQYNMRSDWDDGRATSNMC